MFSIVMLLSRATTGYGMRQNHKIQVEAYTAWIIQKMIWSGTRITIAYPAYPNRGPPAAPTVVEADGVNLHNCGWKTSTYIWSRPLLLIIPIRGPDQVHVSVVAFSPCIVGGGSANKLFENSGNTTSPSTLSFAQRSPTQVPIVIVSKLSPAQSHLSLDDFAQLLRHIKHKCGSYLNRKIPGSGSQKIWFIILQY